MCGITGKISFTSNEVAKDAIAAMNSAIAHRGPDDTGIYISPNKKVGLGHQRLSIIDLSSAGHQPMRYMDRYEIVFNGEIYNFQEKREELKKRGYQFASNTDTEVIMALYDAYKEKCVDHLRGMFSFVIYDEHDETIFCVRDRIGKKPFKYYFDDNVFLFASELKAILTQKEYTKEPDYIAIHHYLTLQYCPAPLTGFKNIKKLESAHYLFIDLKTKKVTKKRYWKLDYSEKLDLSEKEWQKKIFEKLQESINIRMISDVPIGAFLSGGIDSSAVVAMMAHNSSQPIKTFSIGFKEEKYNELPYARMIANKFKTNHTEFIVKPDAIKVLPMLVRQYEEPYADSSALPTYYVSKLTREHVTVALNGDGGDENFGGYNSYRFYKITLFYDQYFKYVHRFILVPIVTFFAKNIKNDFLYKLSRLVSILSQSPSKRFTSFMCHFTNEMKSSLYTEHMKSITAHADTFDLLPKKSDESEASDPMDKVFYTDINSYLADDLMPKVDIASMSVSLEARSPFLDHEFMELTSKIPSNLKIKGFNQKKYILKKCLERIIPHEILYRKKMGFGIPLDAWFRNELQEYVHETLLSEKSIARGIFKKEEIEKILEDHTSRRRNLGYYLWNLLTLELWFEAYFD